jgi:hypothetical protein
MRVCIAAEAFGIALSFWRISPFSAPLSLRYCGGREGELVAFILFNSSFIILELYDDFFLFHTHSCFGEE